MNITVYSHLADTPDWRINRYSDDLPVDPIWTGTVSEARDLEDLFRIFNRVDQADCDRLAAIGYTLPSLTAGDIVTVDGNPHIVLSMGFEPISDADVDLYKRMSLDAKFRILRGWFIALHTRLTPTPASPKVPIMTCQAVSRYGHECRHPKGHRGCHETWTDGSTKKADARWNEDMRDAWIADEARMARMPRSAFGVTPGGSNPFGA